MTATYESGVVARRNGDNIETQICELLKATVTNQPVDIEFDGIAGEIKSCQVTTVDSHVTTGKRSGRFFIKQEQHDYLVERDGVYIFVVHDEYKIVHSRIVKARDIVFKSLPASVCWKKIING